MADERRWYIVRTNIRCEARAATTLRRARYRVYVPKLRKDIRHHRSKEWITKRFILFPRYIFVAQLVRRPDWFTLRQCDGVESVLGIDGVPYEVPRDTVARFLMAQRNGDFDLREGNTISGRQRRALASARFRRGQAVRVLTGPFAGFAGHVESIEGRGIVKAAIEIFTRLTPVEFEPDQIEPLDATQPAA